MSEFNNVIAFNRPFVTGNEIDYIKESISNGQISGNGKYTKMCQEFFKDKYGFNQCLLTTSCTDALEMAAILIKIEEGDEVIMPSYTFVSTANAFVLRGAKIIFVDSRPDHPGIDESKIEALITSKTKAIVPVHYAGMSCDMDVIMEIANRYNLFVIEDAAQAIDNYYIGKDGTKKALGSIGHLAAFSFHETKNIISGEGGLLVINDIQFSDRAEIIWDKGTNRSSFFRGEVDKYGWVDVGSSFLPSEMISAFLWAQLESLDKIQNKRKAIWKSYYEGLKVWGIKNEILLPTRLLFSDNNFHMFYLMCKDLKQRTELIDFLRKKKIHAVFHYLSLHKSDFYADKHDGRELLNSDHFSECIVRLPLYYELDVNYVIEKLLQFES